MQVIATPTAVTVELRIHGPFFSISKKVLPIRASHLSRVAASTNGLILSTRTYPTIHSLCHTLSELPKE